LLELQAATKAAVSKIPAAIVIDTTRAIFDLLFIVAHAPDLLEPAAGTGDAGGSAGSKVGEERKDAPAPALAGNRYGVKQAIAPDTFSHTRVKAVFQIRQQLSESTQGTEI